MHIPNFIKGAFFGPAFIGLVFILKLTCPVSVDLGCLADYLAVPVFLPLSFAQHIMGDNFVIAHELLFMFVYWSLVGMFIGFIFDLHKRQSQY